jgi:hypothetical protein
MPFKNYWISFSPPGGNTKVIHSVGKTKGRFINIELIERYPLILNGIS